MSLRRCDTSESVTIEQAFPGYGENPIGMALRGARNREDVTQRELADMTGLPLRHICEMETGKRQIGKEGAKKLAEALYFSDYRIFINARLSSGALSYHRLLSALDTAESAPSIWVAIDLFPLARLPSPIHPAFIGTISSHRLTKKSQYLAASCGRVLGQGFPNFKAWPKAWPHHPFTSN